MATSEGLLKLLETTGKTLKKAAVAVVNAVTSPEPERARDPWYHDDERKAAINARPQWLRRRRGGWLR